MSHVLLSKEAVPCIRYGAALAVLAVSLIGATTAVQVWRTARPAHSLPAAYMEAPTAVLQADSSPIVPEGMSDIETETAGHVQRTGDALREGLTPEVVAFADRLYIGVSVWKMKPGQPMDEWTISFVNAAASPTLHKNMRACVGGTVFECFPELNNDAGRRYGELAQLSLATRRTIHVGTTRFAQASGNLNTYYNALTFVDDTHVAVLYHVIDGGPAVKRGRFALGLDLPESRAVDVQLRVLSAVAEELDRKLGASEETNVGH
jgi:hypothetical protein